MAQYAYPIFDIENSGSWTISTGSTLYGVLDETTADDNDYITKKGVGTTCTVGLGSMSDPSSSSDHILNVRYKVDPGGTA